MEDSIRMLSTIFHKILKINLTEDTHEDIKVYTSEIESTTGYAERISDWLHKFAEYGNIHEEDMEDYLTFTDIERLRSQFRQHNNMLRLRYRRKTKGQFRWVSMELLPSIEYTDDNQVVMLYIRDIHDEYVSQLQYQKDLEYYCNYDNLTGIHNRYSYNQFCSLHDSANIHDPIAVIFADVNGLKFMNDHFGHEQGDIYIKSAADLLVDCFDKSSCYRVSGDEFIVILDQISEEDFIHRFDAFHQQLLKQDTPIVSVGAAWTNEPATISELVRKAETKMYADKQAYYERHPHFKR